MKKICMLGAALAMYSATALAQSWYVGASAGTARSDVDAARIDNDLTDNLGFFSSNTRIDKSDAAWRVFAGVGLARWLDVEVYYADLGTTSWKSTVAPTGTLTADIDTKAYGIAAIAGISPLERLRIFAKAGVARTEADARFSGTGFVTLSGDSVARKNTSAVYGLGAQYAFTPRFALRLEYDVHEKVGSDAMGGRFEVGTASLGVVGRF